MSWLDALRTRMSEAREHAATGPPVRPRGWARRHRALLIAVVVLLAGAALVGLRPWESCGAGLHSVSANKESVGSSYVCVGLNLDSGPVRDDDPLDPLEKLVKARNEKAGADFKTIVVLENLAPDPKVDSQPFLFVQREVQGAITGAWPKNGPPGIKLLLANYGSNADHWRVVADEIIAAAAAQRIAAVTDVGTSSENSRALVAELSRHGIATIGATVTADNMNTDPKGARIENFFRVGPTNTDEARAAAGYIATHGFQRVMMIQGVSKEDTYATTLAEAFLNSSKVPVIFTKTYDVKPLADKSREVYLRGLFRSWHNDICGARPDLIYFAGRGLDLGALVAALAGDGACEGVDSVTVMTGDDASTLAGKPLELNKDISVRLRYTALAYPDQWDMFTADPAYPTYKKNHDNFIAEFTGTHGFPKRELWDGAAMIEHDAVAAAVEAAMRNVSADPVSMANMVRSIDCNSSVPGATGFVAFDQTTGNQLDKALPILSIAPDGSVHPVDLVWSRGRPLNTAPDCGR
ncbi:amino acid ABC transporter substrate-binding protein [Amycolatopsis speibonae]|uniref:Amino acid ABC transporter substrate-binding protein n=1 Tax=Amycolatopsis speibonae TaxID=1450224 RepID=A0ABV7P4D2_9PSEU